MTITGLRIVLVEDEPAHAEAVRRAFQAVQSVAEVEIVGSLSEYRQTVNERPPSIAIVDLNLPDGKAVDLLTWPPEAGQCPVVVMTSFGSEQTAVDAMRAGALDYLVKSPEAFAGMPRTVERALREWRLLQERRHQAQLLEARLRLSEGAASSSFEDLLRAVCDEAERLTQSQVGFLLFLDEHENAVTMNAWSTGTLALCMHAAKGRHRPVTEAGTWAECVRERTPKVYNDLVALIGPDAFPPGHPQITRELVVPISISDRIVAALGVGNKGQPYDERDIEALSGLGTMAWDIVLREQAKHERLLLERRIQETQKLESLGVLAGGIAHDFNNLLMAILGHAELVLEEVPDDSAAGSSAREIVAASHHAADLCGQMLAYSGSASFVLEPIDLGLLIEEMAHLLTTTISKRAVLHLEVEPGLPLILADPSRLRQVVMNLILNASDATAERSGTITVSVDTEREGREFAPDFAPAADDPDHWVRLQVVDDGVGMDPTTQARIFEPFFTTKFVGRGLGLAAVRGIVHGHHGTLAVESEPGRGTTFRVFFPALTPSDEPIASAPSAASTGWRGSGTVLLADDEEAVREITSRMLQRLGFSVLTARDGGEAVQIYRTSGNDIDLVILDLTMPEVDGVEALARLRALDPGVRVVLASGYSPSDIRARVAEGELVGTLQKPYSLAKLCDLLSGLMPQPPAACDEGS